MDKDKLQGIELNEEELKQVNGGAKRALYEVSVGNVFLKDNDTAYIVKSNVTANNNDPYVPIIIAGLIGNTWQVYGHVDMPMSVLNDYTYSQALSGTLNHLLN